MSLQYEVVVSPMERLAEAAGLQPPVGPPVPEDGILVDGEMLRAIEAGHSDTDDSTVLHVPSIDLVVAADHERRPPCASETIR
jgi:hypothetical protein